MVFLSVLYAVHPKVRFSLPRAGVTRCRNLLLILAIAAVFLNNACKDQGASIPAEPSRVAGDPANRSAASPSNSPVSFKGVVTDEQTAIAIAVAAWIPIYGKENIEKEKPYHATLKNRVWTVTGTLPAGYDGGTAVADISQDDGRILRVTHYK